jgi:proline iminopeptidase
MVIARQEPQICPPMIPFCSRSDSVLFTPKMPATAGCFNFSRSPIDDPPISEPHRIYWAEYGNPTGEPVLFIHGGPGGGCTDEPKVSRFFDPKRYRIILFDQRGCGKSEPTAAAKDPTPALTNNETRYLIEDIIQLRKAVRIRDKMHVFGGSWGSTLVLAYAVMHPHTVQTLILRGIFLCRKNELDYFYQGNAATDQPTKYNPSLPGTYMFFPESWKLFVELFGARR